MSELRGAVFCGMARAGFPRRFWDAALRLLQDCPDLYFRSPLGELRPWVSGHLMDLRAERDAIAVPEVPGEFGDLGHAKARHARDRAAHATRRAAHLARHREDLLEEWERKTRRSLRRASADLNWMRRQEVLFAGIQADEPGSRVLRDGMLVPIGKVLADIRKHIRTLERSLDPVPPAGLSQRLATLQRRQKKLDAHARRLTRYERIAARTDEALDRRRAIGILIEAGEAVEVYLR